MTRKEIKTLIDKKRKELSFPYEKSDDYYYLKQFLEHNKCSKVADFLNIDVCEFTKCLYFVKVKDKSIDECCSKIDSFLPYILKNFGEEDLNNFMNMSLTFYKDGEIKKIIEYFEENSLIKSNLLFRTIYPGNSENRKLVKKIKKLDNLNDMAISEFFKLLSSEHDICLDLMNFIKAIKVMEKIGKDLDITLDEFASSTKERDRDDTSSKECLYMNTLFNNLCKISRFVNEVENEEVRYNKNQSRELSGLDIAEKLLFAALDGGEITDARQIIKTVKDEELRCDFLRAIYSHNMMEYEKIENEFEILSKSAKTEYQALLRDYNISVDDNLFSLIRQNSLEDVSQILEIISKICIDDRDMIKILVNTNLKSVMIVKGYVDIGVLSKNFLQNNIDIFYISSSKRTLLQENIKVLNSYGVSPSLFRNSIDILLADSPILKKGMTTLLEYDLIKSIRTASEYGFILDEELGTKIDKFVELGYENSLEENLSLLNSSKLKRLEVLKAMGMNEVSTKELEKALNGTFIIKDNELDDYIPSVVKYKDRIIMGDSAELLTGYKSGFRAYNINGVIISSNKVSKLVNEGYDLYDALFSNLNLSEDEYELVMEGLSQKKIIKR